MEEKKVSRVPNFDDIDLGIIGIVIIAVSGFITTFMVLWVIKKVEPASLAAMLAFGSTGMGVVAALIRGNKRESTTK